MKFGVALPGIMPMTASGWSDVQVVEGIAAVAQKADALGLEYVSCCDHPVIPREHAGTIGTRWFDPVATLGFVAGMTRRVRLLTSVVVLPYRTPFEMAKALGTLDSISGGRIIFGVGVGHLEREFEVLGANYAERGPVSDEYIQIIKALWTSDSASFHGKYWDFENVVVSPRPVADPHPPVWVGGNAKASVRRAVLYAEGWHPMQLSIEEYRVLTDYAGRLIEETGRTAPMTFTARIEAISPGGIAASSEPPPEAEPERLGDDVPYHVRVSRGARTAVPLATAGEVCERVRGYAEAGATMMNLGFRFDELPPLLEAMEWAAEEVLPEFD